MRSTFFNHTLVRFGFAAAALVAAGAASAVPITDWTYSVSSVFRNNIGDTLFQADSNGCEQISTTSISWGNASPCGGARPGPDGPLNGDGRSSIGIANTPNGGTMITNGAAQAANTYTHINYGVTATDRSLLRATIASSLTLTDQLSGVSRTLNAVYGIRLSETSNQAGTCVVTTSPIPCNDIWVITGSLNNSFIIDDNEYFFSFYAQPALASLGSTICNVVSAATPCIGFTTVEGQANAVTFMLAVTSQQIVIPGEVSEPASIALLGVGLLGLAGVRRRQNKA